MAKKKLSKQPTAPLPGITRKVVGSGITETTRTVFSGPFNEEGKNLLLDMLERASNCPFAVLEDTLRAFLREAGLPDDPTEGGKYPHRSHITPELAENERHSGTWYAAAVLDDLASIRWMYDVAADRDKKAVYHAALAGFRAGELHREAVMKFEWEPGILKYRGEQRNKALEQVRQRQAAAEPWHENLRREAAKIRAKTPGIFERTIASRLYHHPTKPGGTLSKDRIRKIIEPA